MIGGQINNNSCEVFDSFARKFTFVKFQFNFVKNISPKQIVSIGNKVYFFVKEQHKDVMIYSFDVKKHVFGLKTFLKIDSTENFCCTKVPMY